MIGRRRYCSKQFRQDVSAPEQWDSLPTLTDIAFDNLEALGLIRGVGGFSDGVRLASGDDLIFLPYYVTALGRFVQRSLDHEAIRMGMAAVNVAGEREDGTKHES